MKKKPNKKQLFFKRNSILGFILFFLSLTVTAQQGINYKAIIKDNAGNVVANDLIVVQFSILKGTAQTNVYTETSSPTTTANGLIVLNIGEGTVVSGDFTTIDWGSDNHFLNVQINKGAGLTDMGTTAFGTVPYALHAKNVTGLEKITENGQTGWRMVERDNVNYGDVGTGAIDLSYNDGISTTRGATGEFSIATGKRTTASGIFSTAMGGITTASGNYSTAMGNNSKAESYGQTSLGMYNTIVAGTIDSFVATDRLFVIGNGVNNNNKSDALIILKNGAIIAPSLNTAEITDAKSLITKEYIETKIYSIGDIALGGVVIWVDQTGHHGLICSLDNLSENIAWMDHDDSNSFSVNFTSGNGIGAGKLNTAMILSSNDVQNLSNTNFATLLCATYSETDINGSSSPNTYDDGGGTITISYGDWYLPSIYELSLIYPNKELINNVCLANGGDNLEGAEFWSSNQYSDTEAWEYFMFDNAPSPETKGANHFVRAFRSF